MSNYTKATNFATKDTLPTGDSNKIVKGTEIDNEFNSISGAISSKADTASPTFTGTPAAPTATAGSNTTQIATTAFVTAVTSTLGNMSTQAKSAVDITGGTIVGITDLAVADGGTGRSTLAANAVLVGNGTSGINSVAPSTSGNVLTSDGTNWTSTAATPSIGVGQTWQNVTASRAFSTTYTNSTGKPIMVSVNLYNGGGDPSSGIGLTVGGVLVGNAYQPGIANGYAQLSAIVPNGTTYSCTGTTLGTWLELR
jgi:hypothetical protein